MTFRARLRLAAVLIVLAPVIGFALIVRQEMGRRLTAQYQRRVQSRIAIIEGDLGGVSEDISQTLGALGDALRDDNRFRRAAVDGAAAQRAYLLDYAARAMRLTGLGMLQIQDSNGRIISSGHFRMEYDRLEPELPRQLAKARGELALVSARTPESPFLALARVDSVQMGGRRFHLVGGISAERRFLAGLEREPELTVALVYPGGEVTSAGTEPAAGPASLDASARPDSGDAAVTSWLDLPYVDAERGRIEPARIRVTHSLDELRALRRNIDLWLLFAVAVTLVVAILLANSLATRISRPLEDLARKTSRIDLDRLDIDFASRRRDEIGALSRLLGAMTERLRASAGRIKDAERRATLGELARQVNHDIKNGLMPIRNVFRHLTQVAKEQPEQLADVLEERRTTIDAGIGYLETLASNYARLSPKLDRQPCDVNDVVRQVVSALAVPSAAELKVELSPARCVVMGDAVVLRRIVENLVDNAVESLTDASGTVSVSTGLEAAADGPPLVRLAVADSGRGMSEDEQGRAFDDFYTTKEHGTGLGLSIVRRLVTDLGGSIRFESAPGKGSRFTVELPAAGQDAGTMSTTGDDAADAQRRGTEPSRGAPGGVR